MAYSPQRQMLPDEPFGDLRVGRLRVGRQQRVGRHNEAARADAALEAAVFPEGALNRVQGRPRRRPLASAGDGQDLLPTAEASGQDGAAVDRAAVDHDGARATLGAVAAQVGAGHAQLRVIVSHRLSRRRR